MQNKMINKGVIEEYYKEMSTPIVFADNIFKVGSIYSLFGHPNRQNPLICQTTVV